MTQALNVWMNGEHVGTWTTARQSHVFRYALSWLESPRCRSLSQSIPISTSLETKGDVVKNYFDNLLPDNQQIRARLSTRFKTKSAEAFDLLEAIGRDCVGAVQLLPENTLPDGWNRIACEPLSEERLIDVLEAASSDTGRGNSSEDELYRISIAGAQEKTALVRHKNRWCLPQGATPTTHIFKLPLGLIGGSRRVDAQDSVQNEWLCARIMTELGFPVASTHMEDIGGRTILVIERFDRAMMDGATWIARLPQEDFCQAMGLPPSQKYEEDGGPGIAQCLQLLQGSGDQNDASLFVLTQLAFYLLGATDGHAKNFSLFLNPGDAYEMTPLYDILSMYPYFGGGPNHMSHRKAGPAMYLHSKNVQKRYYTIAARHWHGLAKNCGGDVAWNAMVELAQAVAAALDATERALPKDFPGKTWDAIAGGMSEAAKRFLREAEDLKS